MTLAASDFESILDVVVNVAFLRPFAEGNGPLLFKVFVDEHFKLFRFAEEKFCTTLRREMREEDDGALGLPGRPP